MQHLLAFDIGNDRLRRRVEKDCRDAGMERTQWSAFIGELDDANRGMLIATLRLRIEQFVRAERKRDKGEIGLVCIQIFPICAADFAKAVELDRKGQRPVEPYTLPDLLIM